MKMILKRQKFGLVIVMSLIMIITSIPYIASISYAGTEYNAGNILSALDENNTLTLTDGDILNITGAEFAGKDKVTINISGTVTLKQQFASEATETIINGYDNAKILAADDFYAAKALGIIYVYCNKTTGETTLTLNNVYVDSGNRAIGDDGVIYIGSYKDTYRSALILDGNTVIDAKSAINIALLCGGRTGDHSRTLIGENVILKGTISYTNTPTVEVTDNRKDVKDVVSAGSLTTSEGAVQCAWSYGGYISESEGTFTVTPYSDGDVNYVIDKIYKDGVAVDVSDNTAAIDVSDVNQSLFASFAYTVNFNDPANGILSVSRGSETLMSGDIVRGGDVLKITVTGSSSGYALDELTLTGIHDNEDGTYTVSAVNGEKTPAVSATMKMTETVANPVFSPSSGIVAKNSVIAISCSTADASIYYTTDGTEPSAENGTLYSEPVYAGENEFTLKAIAVKNGCADSEVVSATFTPAQEYEISTEISGNAQVLLYVNNKIVTSAASGAEVTLTAFPYGGYAVNNITVTGAGGETILLSSDNTFIMPESSVTVKVEAQKAWLNLQMGDALEGLTWNILSVNGDTSKARSVESGSVINDMVQVEDTVSFSISGTDSVKTCGLYAVDEYGDTIRGVEISENSGVYTFTMPDREVFLSISAFKAQYGAGGIVNDIALTANDSNVSYSDMSASIIPDTGKRIKNISLSSDNGATWSPADYTIDEDGVCKFSKQCLIKTYAPGGRFTITNNMYILKAEFADDAGEYTISNEQELKNFAEEVKNGDMFIGKTVKLADDIILTDSWQPIGSDENYFTGIFDGNEHTISGININETISSINDTDTNMFIVDEKQEESPEYKEGTPKYLGLFAYLKGASVKDLTVTGNIAFDNTAVDFASELTYDGQSCVGGIAGYAENSSFEGCNNEIDISAHSGFIGGLAGKDENGSYSHCLNYGDLTVTRKNNCISGIASNDSYKPPLMMECCGNYGNITVGGTKTNIKVTSGAGDTSGGTVVQYDIAYGSAAGLATACSEMKLCFNKGTVSGRARYMAGLISGGVFENTSQAKSKSISDSYNIGKIEETAVHISKFSNEPAYTAGLVGLANENCSITGCYNAGDIIGSTNDGKSDELYCCSNTSADIADSCLKSADIAAKAEMNDNYVTEGKDFPELKWESDLSASGTYDVTFDTNGINAEIKLYSDSSYDNEISSTEGSYNLAAGTYYYKAKADGYNSINGTVIVTRRPVTVKVNFSAVTNVTFNVVPKTANLVLKTASGLEITPKSKIDGAFVFELQTGASYQYTVSASGYNSVEYGYTVPETEQTVSVVLQESSYNPGTTVNDVVYGTGNTGQTNNTIQSGGTYYIGEGAAGVLTINTSEAVTLVGKGLSTSDRYSNLYINCAVSGANLTMKDVYINNELGSGNLINFKGSGNKLNFKGTNILNQDTGASGYAMIHVNTSTSLKITGGIAYLYKHEQGACIGGNGGADGSEGKAPEYNGNIEIEGATLFIKSSKQGAGIGAGADANSTSFSAGNISIDNSNIYMIANSRSAAIGGGAGGTNGASQGTTVNINNSCVTINVDFSGAAIGGGGYDGGNDASGGTVYINNSSVRTHIDSNAESSWGVSAGVNDKAITASKKNSNGDVYLCPIDTSSLGGAEIYTDAKRTNSIYSAGLHKYAFVNEDLNKSMQSNIIYTVDNWTEYSDSNVYLYLTGENHTFYGNNGSVIDVKWNDSSKSFTVTIDGVKTEKPASNTGGGAGAVNKVTETVTSETKVENGTATTDVPKENITAAIENVGTQPNTNIVIEAVSNDPNVTKSEVNIPKESVNEVKNGTSADLVVSTDLGKVAVSNADLPALTGTDGENVNVVLEKNENGSVNVSVTVDGNSVPSDKNILKVTVKVPDSVMADSAGSANTNPNLVAVLVDKNGNQTIVKNSVITSDGYAKLLMGTEGTVSVINNSRTFGDVASDAWFNNAVAFASSHELFKGISDSEFGPSVSMTRGMFVTVLSRLTGAEDYTGTSKFTDVTADQWYSKSVAWASANNVVSGYGNGMFGPDDSITREQMAVILYNYVQAMGLNVSGSASLDNFSDAESVDEWALDAMQWAYGTGLMEGNADGTLNPLGNATRAEVATIMENFVNIMLK